MKRQSPEDKLQMNVVRALNRTRLPADLWWSAINPKPGKHIRTAIKSKDMGLRAGVPDLLFVHRGEPFGIELKAGKGDTSDAQQGMHAQMERAGCPVYVATSVEAVAGILGAHGVALDLEMVG